MSYLDELNSAQRQAVSNTDGPLLVLAGAGTGKTRTITYRIVYLIKNGVSPDKILAVTFTNKAASEMRERVYRLINSDQDLNRPVSAFASGFVFPLVSTFHALCVRLLREFYRELNLQKSFTIFDRSDSVRAVKRATVQLGLDIKQYEPRGILNAISKHKGDGITESEYANQTFTNPHEEVVASVWREYEKILAKENALDFDDLLLRVYLFLKNNKNILKKLQERWSYIHVDEYQDTNQVQFEIIKLLAGTRKNICAVGDTDQCIYTWRQARVENLLNFEDEFTGTRTVLLEQNYRSTQTILAAANDIIEKNTNRHDKKLFTKNAEGEKINVYSAMDAGDEARAVVNEIERLINSSVCPSEIAVLYRANFQSRSLEESFFHSKIPYQVLGTKFFDRKEIKDVLSYVRAALNPSCFGDIARIVATPPRGIGKQTLAHMIDGTLDKLSQAAQKKVEDFKKLLAEIKNMAENLKVSEALRFTIRASGLEAKLKNGTEEDKERYENMQELVTLATKYDSLTRGEGIEKMIEDAALATDQDELEENTNSVKLMTVHAAKGLEFDYVFIVGLEEGLFPHERLEDETHDEEEERRLFYVALTRARKKIFLSHTFVRTIYGKQQVNVPSQFISDINSEHTEESNSGAKNLPHSRGMSLMDDIDF